MIWRPAYHRRIAQAADAVTTALSFVVAYEAWHWTKIVFPGAPIGQEIEITSELYWVVGIFSLIWVLVFARMSAYTYQRFTSLKHEIKIVLKVSALCTLLVFAAIVVLRVGYVPRTYIFGFFMANAACLIAEKFVMFRIAQKIREAGRNRKRVVVVGNGLTAKTFVETVETNLGWGLDIVGVIANGGSGAENIRKQRFLGSLNQIEDVLHTNQVDEVVICASGEELGKIERVFEVCEREGVQVRLNSEFFGRLAKSVSIDYIYGLPIISFTTVPNNEWLLYAKRLVDIVVSLFCLIILLPAFLLIALLIKLTSPGPVFYRWNVIGLNKKPLASWKFRTMMDNADEIKGELMARNEMSGPVFKIKNDPRMTSVGRFLRKYSLDELPQLWSVLKGDMSLVGPRPAGPHELVRYESWQRRKLSIKPGITCLWQANGRNQITDFDQWARLDLEYIDNWSLWLDFKILVKTARAVLRGTGC
jgi:exopolysaccharide biosynthesis polyprenyl glycosylphosphotransferase